MKCTRLTRIPILMILCIALSTCALAAEFANVYALFVHWDQNGYPSDVAGVYSTDGSTDHLTIQLIGDADGSREAEIRAMLDDDSTVTFEAGTYSEQELQHIHREIVDTYLSRADSGVYGCGVGWSAEGGFGPSGNESRVVVTVDESRYTELLAELVAAYGDAVFVEIGSPAVPVEQELPDQELPEQPANIEAAMKDAAQDGTDEAAANAPAAEALTSSTAQAASSAITSALCISLICLSAAAIILIVLLLRGKKRKS